MDNKELFMRDRVLLYLKKNKDYGNSFTESLEKHGDIAFIVRGEDKINRFKSLLTKDTEVVGESITDTVLDLLNYVIMFEIYKAERNTLIEFILAYEECLDENFRLFILNMEKNFQLGDLYVNKMIEVIKNYINNLR